MISDVAQYTSAERLAQQLVIIENLPAEMSGVYLVHEDGQLRGTIHVDRGKLCWATAPGKAARLTELLCAPHGQNIHRPTLRALCEHCLRTGASLIDALVDKKLITADELRMVLLHHTAECLLALEPLLSGDLRWHAHPHGTYDAAFSFDPLEAATWIGGLLHPELQLAASSELTQIVPAACFAAAYPFTDRPLDLVPVCCVHATQRSVQGSLELARWAHHELRAAHTLYERPRSVVGIGGSGQALVAWSSAAGFCAAVCDSTAQLARLLSSQYRYSAQAPR